MRRTPRQKRAVEIDILFVVLVFRFCLGVRLIDDHGLQIEDEYASRIATRGCDAFADRGHGLLKNGLRRGRDEDALGVLAGEAAPARRSARLIKHWRSLWRGLAEMDARDLEIAALMADGMDLCRIGEDAPSAVAEHRIVLPTSFPQLVADLHIFVGDVVAIIMRALAAQTNIFRAAVEIGGNDVPAGASLCQMVEGREAARERVGVLEGKGGGQPEAEILCDKSHRRHELQRIVDGDLRRVAKGGVKIAIIDVIDAKHVRDEKAVELAALQNLGELDPIFEILVLPRTVARMRP